MSWQPIPSVTAPHYLDRNLGPIGRVINWYLHRSEDGFILRNLPGYQLRSTVANNAACRGAKFDPVSGKIYSVHGNTVYDTGGSALTGTLSTSSGAVVIASGLSSVMIVDGSYGYIINPTAATVTKITDANFPTSPISCACINGQFLAIKGGTDRWYMSAVDDGATWTPLISGRAITNGDTLYHVEVVRDTVYFMGGYSIEPWYSTTIDPYLQPVTGATHPVGISGTAGVSRVGDTILFYGIGERARGSLWMISGGQLSEIATPHIKSIVGAWNGSATRCFAYSNEGYEFFEVYDNGSPFGCWCFNITNGTWSETTSNRILYTVVNGLSSGVPPTGFSTNDGSVFWLGASNEIATYQYNSFAGTSITRTLDFQVDGGMSRIFNAGIRFEFEIQHDSTDTFTFSASLYKSDDAGRTFSSAITLSKNVTQGTTPQKLTVATPPLGSAAAGRLYRLVITSLAARLILRRAEGLVREGRF
jgi:hypothetical protein